MRKKYNSLLFHLLFLSVMLVMTACGPPGQELTPTQFNATETQPSQNHTPTLQQSIPTETATPIKSLTICSAELPADLLPYSDNSSINKSNLLSLVYEEPFLQIDGELAPLILEKVPSQADGDLVLNPVLVQAGQTVVDSKGQVRILTPDLQVRPAGCRDSDCVITLDGETSLEMDQMVVDYKLREDLRWSDGTPVTADDSVFSFDYSVNLTQTSLSWALRRTADYQAVNETVVQWRGLPGFTTADLSHFFWKPLAAHIYQDSVNQAAQGINQIGYGPYTLSSHVGDALVFSRNPYYFRAEEGLPKFDQIQVRQVVGRIDAAWADSQNSDCDVWDSTYNVLASPEFFGEIQTNSNFDALVEAGDSWMQLVFGIKPASYDDFYNPELGDRLDYLGDPRVRKAIMHCLDRDTMLEVTLDNLGEVWQSYLPSEESALETTQFVNYDPVKGVELLQSVGWYDLDGNPSTPLQSWYAPNMPGGAPLSLDFLISPNPFHQKLAEVIQMNLAECGVGVTIREEPIESLYAPGPEGPLFGRGFDLALISWQPVPGGDCQLYQSWEMPSEDNYWIGTNIAGLLNEGYDDACAEAVLALPDEKVGADREAELAFLNSLPAVPLFSTPKILVLPAGGCIDDGISGEKEFFTGIATFGMGEMCP